MKLEDLALTRYRFFRTKCFKDDENSPWDNFDKLIKNAVEEIGGSRNTFPEKVNKKDPKIGYFVPVLTSRNNKGSDIVFFNKFHRTLISGIYLDVYTLQNSIGLAGELADVSQLSTKAGKIKKQFDHCSKIEFDRCSKIESELLTDCFCYFTEFPESDSDTEEIFSTLLKTENFSAVELDYAYFATDFADGKAVAVIISKNLAETIAKDKATKLCDVLLREYFLSYTKVVFEAGRIKTINAESGRQTLLAYLGEFEKKQPTSLTEIESANRDLTKCRVGLAEEIKAIEVHLHTIEINIGNAEKILDNPLLRQKKDDLRRMLINPLQLQAEQIKVDLTYLNIDVEKAKIIGEGIANLSNLQAGIYGRKLAWFFGTLTLIGALQLFPEEFNLLLLWARILILATIIFIPILILFRRDITDRISNDFKRKFRSTENKQIAEQKPKDALPPMSAQDETAQMDKEKETENK